MSSEKSKKVQTTKTTIRVDSETLEWLTVLRDAQNFPSLAEAVHAAVLRAYPNIEEIVRMARKKEDERRAALRDIAGIDEEKEEE